MEIPARQLYRLQDGDSGPAPPERLDIEETCRAGADSRPACAFVSGAEGRGAEGRGADEDRRAERMTQGQQSSAMRAAIATAAAAAAAAAALKRAAADSMKKKTDSTWVNIYIYMSMSA